MALTPGTRVGPYEVVSAIGAGGMGEVYRARDTKLGRDVALKLLPDVFAANPERLQRLLHGSRPFTTGLTDRARRNSDDTTYSLPALGQKSLSATLNLSNLSNLSNPSNLSYLSYLSNL